VDERCTYDTTTVWKGHDGNSKIESVIGSREQILDVELFLIPDCMTDFGKGLVKVACSKINFLAT
jgi:hypothetical protein